MNPVTDAPGWGAAEWIAVATIVTTIIGSITTLVVQMRRLRKENTDQHAEGRAIQTDMRDRLLNLHETIDHIDEKVDEVAEGLANHEKNYHRPRRW